MTSTTLSRYYAAVDAGDFDTAMALLAPDVRSAIQLPGGVVRGKDRQALRDYLSGRGNVLRRHVLLRESVVDGLELVYGAVVDDGTTTTGHFIAAARLGEDGLVSGYQVAFDPELALLDDA
ncbi:nuclear transport factor 2 family protein [Nocardioides bizhenqiangii]|uniref:Nuclear transport factor 2 family protein n=1 Tax=Nocardioides bizhenqiangii TaxID=3095076 RepID=A0ABZ0ZVV0_9ACTN|nr:MULTISPECIES: nuclear transport factor 2 family protein [unclassified Nocardioides]MDZ5622401.1 nuclear transport factor 2 family protein [Nocardioides sp. HM23]WQQ28430.1 nuclear transport factor 2 family protein [Nocardioides sp. HM61]